MTLKEAIESGKKFRQPYDDNFWYSAGGRNVVFAADEVLATDWEVEDETVTITKEQLKSAIEATEAACSPYVVSISQGQRIDYTIQPSYSRAEHQQGIPQNYQQQNYQQNYQGAPHQCPKYYIDANFVWDKLKEAQDELGRRDSD